MANRQRLLSRVEALIHRQTPQYVAASVVPRGTAIPVDKFMTGASRFARKIGSTFPVISAATTMRTTKAATRGATSIEVEALLAGGIPSGSIISFGELELQFVEDSSIAEKFITLSNPAGLLAAYPVGTKVFLHAVPLRVALAVSAGSTSVRVASDHLMVIGDVVLEVLSAGVGGSTTSLNVTGITIVQEDTVPYTYVLSLNDPLVLAHGAGDDIYLRAFPAYKSILIPLPTQKTVLGGNVGPFLWDYIEGRLHDGIEDPTVIVSTAIRNPAFIEFQGMTITPKNTVNCAVDMPGHMIGLWDIALGKIDYVDGYPRATTDSQGDFLVFTNLVPSFPGGHSWYAGFSSNDPVAVRIGFRYRDVPDVDPVPPNASYEWVGPLRTMYYNDTLPGDNEVKILLVRAPAVPYDRIEVGFFDEDPGVKIIMRDWSSTCGHSTWVQYTIVSHVNGDYSWAGSGLMLKPMFLHRDGLRTSDMLDTGFVMF